MKSPVLFLFFLLMVKLTVAQDVVLLRDMNSVSGCVTGMNKDTIWMSDSSSAVGQSIAIGRSDVLMIHFGVNGQFPPNSFAMKQSLEIHPANNFPKSAGNGPANAFLSLIYPGWGDYRVREGDHPYWVIGALSYGLVAGGLYMKYRSNELHKDYLASEEIHFPDFKKSNQQHHAYILMTRAGATLWLGDVVLTGMKGFKNRKRSGLSQSNASPAIGFFLNDYGYPGLSLKF